MTIDGFPGPASSGASCEPTEDAAAKATVTVGSLCSGYTGLDMGLALALGVPIRHAWHVEYDGIVKSGTRKGEVSGPRAILAHRYPDVPNHVDLTTLDPAVLEPVDWLTAGYPCQPFSHAGKRKGASDERHLWPHVARTIGAIRPSNVLLENVRGHVSLGLDAVLADLAGLGYDASWGVVRAADAGAPHGRARIFIVATDSQGDAGRLGDRDDVRARSGTLGRREDTGRGVAANAHGPGLEGRHPVRRGGGERAPRPGGVAIRRDAPPHADSAGRRWLAEQHAPAPAGVEGEHRGHADGRSDGTDWRAYTSAVRRWERVTGRPAPRPTEPAHRGTGERLSPRFVEWMMGLPAGWVTDVPDLPRNAQLKALGNGVVPQQAALAVRLLTGISAQEAAA